MVLNSRNFGATLVVDIAGREKSSFLVSMTGDSNAGVPVTQKTNVAMPSTFFSLDLIKKK